MATYDPASFSAGQETGARIAACVARLAAQELLYDSRWWNRRRHRLMARALIAHAEEMERAADEPPRRIERRRKDASMTPEVVRAPLLRSVPS